MNTLLIKKEAICGFIIAVLAALLMITPARAETVDRIVAVINGEVITLSELEQRAGPILEQYLKDDIESSEARIRRQEILAKILPQLVDEYLIKGEVRRKGIKVNDKDVESAIESISKNNNMSMDELIEKLAAEGITLEQYKKDIRQQIERSQLISAQVRSKIVITDEQVKAYLKEHPLSDIAPTGPLYVLQHISITLHDRNNPQAKDDARTRAENALEELKGGKAFEDVARRFSDLPSAREGGRLGSFTLEEMAPFVREAVANLKPGEFSGIVDTPIGWQIFRLKEKIVADDSGRKAILFEETRQKLYRMQINERFQEWLGELRSKSTIRILL